MGDGVKVSVLMITYNHERYIAQALDSVLMQQVAFDYEIVVGEDCSTDATRAILRRYQQQYPERIRVLLPEANLGMVGNFIATYQQCRGEYIALLDGDDYWSSAEKLQRQVDFLDAHPECSACFHNVLVHHEGAPERDRLFHEPPLGKSSFTLKEIVSSHFIPCCATLFRARLFPEFPTWYREMPMQDWPLHVLNAEHGDYGYLDEVLAVYRVHGGGAWSLRNRLAVLDKTIHACHTIRRYLAGRHGREIGRFIREFEIEAADLLAAQHDYWGGLKRLGRAFSASPTSCARVSACTRGLVGAWLRQLTGTATKEL